MTRMEIGDDTFDANIVQESNRSGSFLNKLVRLSTKQTSSPTTPASLAKGPSAAASVSQCSIDSGNSSGSDLLSRLVNMTKIRSSSSPESPTPNPSRTPGEKTASTSPRQGPSSLQAGLRSLTNIKQKIENENGSRPKGKTKAKVSKEERKQSSKVGEKKPETKSSVEKNNCDAVYEGKSETGGEVMTDQNAAARIVRKNGKSFHKNRAKVKRQKIYLCNF